MLLKSEYEMSKKEKIYLNILRIIFWSSIIALLVLIVGLYLNKTEPLTYESYYNMMPYFIYPMGYIGISIILTLIFGFLFYKTK
jgi:Ni,Fe-hydrogenase I cytochrome b subunit